MIGAFGAIPKHLEKYLTFEPQKLPNSYYKKQLYWEHLASCDNIYNSKMGEKKKTGI